MIKDNILNQFENIENSIDRAKLVVEADMCSGANKEVVLYELIKAYLQIENMVREIAPERFAIELRSVSVTPLITLDHVYICHTCGQPDCQSDHK